MKNTAILMFSVLVLSGFLASAHGEKQTGASAYNPHGDTRHWQPAPVPGHDPNFDGPSYGYNDGHYGVPAYGPRPCSDGLRRSAGPCTGDQFPLWGSIFGISGSF